MQLASLEGNLLSLGSLPQVVGDWIQRAQIPKGCVVARVHGPNVLAVAPVESQDGTPHVQNDSYVWKRRCLTLH